MRGRTVNLSLTFQFFLNEWWIQLNFVDFNIHIFLFCFITLKVKFCIDFHIFSVFFFCGGGFWGGGNQLKCQNAHLPLQEGFLSMPR